LGNELQRAGLASECLFPEYAFDVAVRYSGSPIAAAMISAGIKSPFLLVKGRLIYKVTKLMALYGNGQHANQKRPGA